MPDPISLASNVYLYSKTRTTLLFVTLHLWLPTSLIGETYGRHPPYQLTGSDMYGTALSANTHMANPKAAEVHLTRLMAAGLLPYKFRCNSVCPGMPLALLPRNMSTYWSP